MSRSDRTVRKPLSAIASRGDPAQIEDDPWMRDPQAACFSSQPVEHDRVRLPCLARRETLRAAKLLIRYRIERGLVKYVPYQAGKPTQCFDTWIEAGLNELRSGGIERVRVEVLAKNLGLTKGGFYRRFKDRRALLDSILQSWTHGRIEALAKHTQLGGKSARNRLKSLIRLYSERVNPEGMAIELAIRQWARTDAAALAAVMSVDAARVKAGARLYRKLGLATDEAQARAVMLYSYIFGRSLIFLDQPPRKQSHLMSVCAKALTEVERGSA
jgi:AcrR family transcriptional regulator